jgi:glucuronoarabinoxylan endo-1,4-beta-xylanase
MRSRSPFLCLAIASIAAGCGSTENGPRPGSGSSSGASGSGASSGSAAGSGVGHGSSGMSGGSSSGSGSSGSSSGSSGSGSGASGSRSGSGSDAGVLDAGKDAGSPSPGDVVVDPSTARQTIDGFGAADVWQGALTADQGKLFFDPANGIGLSILRIGIETNGTPMGSGAVADVKLAASYGAIVWAAPWSPPAAAKDNNNLNSGGHLVLASYDSWATTLAGFPATIKQQTGVQLYGISAQNEPDFVASSYESCIYSAAEMVSFVKVLGPKLAALNPPVKLIAAEPDNWSHMWTSGDKYGVAILADSAAASAVGVLAAHDYAFSPVAPPYSVTKPIWETEVSGVQGSAQAGPSTDISNGIAVAQWIHNGLVIGGASAWHYWWLISSNADNEGLLLKGGDITSPPKRLYTMGNFSKFVRPGYRRVDVSGPVPTGVQVAAFQNPTDATVAIVAINTNGSSASLPLFVQGTSWPSQVVPWVTSASANLASQTAITVTAARFSSTLAAQSVTTFVGKP